VQNAVHQAVSELLDEIGRESVTVPLIAQRAGVTPSTIYRRWTDIATLLSDVAQRHLRVDCPLTPSGCVASDLVAWAEMYQDEMDSAPGRGMLRDVLAGWDGRTAACTLIEAVRPSIETILISAAPAVTLSSDRVIDGIVAPVLMRLIFSDAPLPRGFGADAARRLVEHL